MGAIDCYTASGLLLSTFVPLTAIKSLGFAFKDYGQVSPAMDDKLGAVMRARIDAWHMGVAGLHTIEDIFDIGFREVSSSTRPITDPASFSAFRIRIPPSALGVSMFRAMDAAPTTLNSAEAYTALQAHVVDGQESPLSRQLHERHRANSSRIGRCTAANNRPTSETERQCRIGQTLPIWTRR